MTIFYTLGDALYVNITNKCSCACVFCVRNSRDSVGGSSSLWLPHEPSFSEIKAAFDEADLHIKKEIVFCGYGEPLERPAEVFMLCDYMKSKTSLPVRINTNGLARLISPGFDMEQLKKVNKVSISLNAHNAHEYHRLVNSRFGHAAFDAMLDFAKDAKAYTQVNFTIVDYSGGPDVHECKILADKLDIPLRIRGRDEGFG